MIVFGQVYFLQWLNLDVLRKSCSFVLCWLVPSARSASVAGFYWWTCSFLTHANNSANYEKRHFSFKMMKSILFKGINNMIWFVLFLILTQMVSSCKSLFFLYNIYSPKNFSQSGDFISSLVCNVIDFIIYLFIVSSLFEFLKHVWFRFTVKHIFCYPHLFQNLFTAVFSSTENP